MKRSHILFYTLLALAISSRSYSQENPNHFVAQPGSSLAKYEAAVEKLGALQSKVQIRDASAQILKDYYGFYSVEFASGNDREISLAAFVAKNLKDILPANKEAQSYIGVDEREIYAQDPERDFALVPVNTARHYRIRFDSKVAGINFNASVVDGQLEDIEGLIVEDNNFSGGQVRKRIEDYKLTLGGKRFLLGTRELKAWMSMMLNYSDLYNVVNFDIK